MLAIVFSGANPAAPRCPMWRNMRIKDYCAVFKHCAEILLTRPSRGWSMRLKRVVLRNIRSYQAADIVLPTGIVLLHGDIGSGKSTILLAIEFALFGLLRGELSGSALLRNGANEGDVALHMDVDGTEYVVARSLRRSKNRIEQSSGYLEVNGVRAVLTPMELKSKVLDLLGYPQELLTKGKALIYRYTVYTPQEDMKRILEDDKEDRLRLLRIVFDMEKYQRIRGNASLYTKQLRDRIRHLEGMLIDLEVKKDRRKRQKQELESLQNERKALVPRMDSAKKQVDDAKKALQCMEQSKEDYDALGKELYVLRARIDATTQQQKQFVEDRAECVAQARALEKELVPLEDTTDLQEKESALFECQQQLMQLQKKSAEFGMLRKQSQETARKMMDLSTCPVCLQEVHETHKHAIIGREKETLKSVYEQEQQIQEQVSALEEDAKQLREAIEQVRERQKKMMVVQERQERVRLLREKADRLVTLQEESKRTQQQLEERCAVLEDKRKELEPKIQGFADAKLALDRAMKEERDVAITLAALDQRIDSADRQLRVLVDELNEKEFAKLKLDKIKAKNSWLEEQFVPLMSEMERHVLARIQQEFDDTFRDWFGMLIEDSLMTARLDDSFTPIVMQNGFETESVWLSGGEKTACALAYRLALNRTINSLLNTIKTKDILILDEPTDGFSEQQLEKMRDVLDELKLNQIILVSHEQKIESFADHVLRIEKEDHVSRVLSN